ncbi:unnamed protein product [Ixodes pacificus]
MLCVLNHITGNSSVSWGFLTAFSAVGVLYLRQLRRLKRNMMPATEPDPDRVEDLLLRCASSYTRGNDNVDWHLLTAFSAVGVLYLRQLRCNRRRKILKSRTRHGPNSAKS